MESIANRLPFDVLCIIFEYFVALDDSSRPRIQETLLLVSRSWYRAASNHAMLWTNIDMHIESWGEMKYWTSCLARRLLRYSANALLDIGIFMYIYSKDLRGDKEAREASERLLLTLVGESGTIARRWRSFMVDDAFAPISSDILAHCFSFPTPNLQRFHAASLICNQDILPDASSLKSFSIINCILAKFPNLETVTRLQVLFAKHDRNSGIDERAVALARNLQSLEIRATKPYKLAAIYPHLTDLELKGEIYEDCLTEFCAPNLNDLTITASSKRDYISVVSCEGIQLKNVKRVKIGVQDLTEEAIPAFLDGIRQFLTHLVNLETLGFSNRDAVHLALKLLTEDCKHLYQSRTLRLVYLYHSGDLGNGEGRVFSVNEFRQQTGCLESDTVNRLLGA